MSEEMARQLPFVLWAYGLSLTVVLLLVITMVRSRLRTTRETRMLKVLLSEHNKPDDPDVLNESEPDHDEAK